MLALQEGENLDSESKLHHIGHILANAAFIAQLEEDGTLVDDRYKVEDETMEELVRLHKQIEIDLIANNEHGLACWDHTDELY